MKQDFTTPEAAAMSLEDAYRHCDIEAAVRAKDFRYEAREMLGETFTILQDDPESIEKLAATLEMAFRKQIEDLGFPDFQNVHSTFSEPRTINADTVTIIETCTHPDGDIWSQELVVVKSASGWKVVAVTN